VLSIIIILVIAAAIVTFEAPLLLKNNLRRELWLFSGLLLFAVGLCIAAVLRLDIPNPLDWIAFVYRPLGDLIFEALE